MKIILYAILLIVGLTKQAVAQNGPIFPKGEKAVNVHHVGNVWLNELSPADSTFNYSTSLATMERGAYLFWHKHPGGQILMITEGTGYYQERVSLSKSLKKVMWLNVNQTSSTGMAQLLPLVLLTWLPVRRKMEKPSGWRK